MFAAIGDLHLGKLIRVMPQSLKWQIKTLDRTLSDIESKGCEEVVLLGDVFDNPEPSKDMMYEFLRVLGKHKLFYHVIPGNHDMSAVDTHSLTISNWMFERNAVSGRVYLKPEVVKIDGMKCWVCPHPYIEDQPSKAELSIGHFPWSGARRDNGTVEQKGSRPKGTWVLGDFHEHQRGKRHVYAGSLTQLTFGENLPKGYLTVDGSDIVFEHITPAYKLATVGVASDDEVVALDKSFIYKVQCRAGYVMPRDWQSRYPYILSVEHSARVKREKTDAPTVIFSDDDPLDGLKPWLKGRKTLTKRQIKVAMKIARRFVKDKRQDAA